MSANKGPDRPGRWKKPPTPPTDAERWERLSPRELALGTHLDVHGLRKELLEAIANIGTNPAIERTLTSILNSLQTLVRMPQMFEDLEAKVNKIVSASDAMQLVLEDVKKKLDKIIADGGIPPAALAKLNALSTALDTEADDIVAKTLANTPAEEPPPPPA